MTTDRKVIHTSAAHMPAYGTRADDVIIVATCDDGKVYALWSMNSTTWVELPPIPQPRSIALTDPDEYMQR